MEAKIPDIVIDLWILSLEKTPQKLFYCWTRMGDLKLQLLQNCLFCLCIYAGDAWMLKSAGPGSKPQVKVISNLGNSSLEESRSLSVEGSMNH